MVYFRSESRYSRWLCENNSHKCDRTTDV